MLQRKYLYKDLKSAEIEISEIIDFIAETPHKAALITVYESSICAKDMEAFIGLLRNSGIPGLQIAGISLSLVAELMPDGRGILLNLILTEEADIEVVTLPCTPGKEAEAAAKLNERLSAHNSPKAVELFGSSMKLKTTQFIEKSMKGFDDTVLFGTTTLRHLLAKMTIVEGESIVEIDSEEKVPSGFDYIFGSTLLYDGFVAVIFSGEKLSVEADYALGWSPIGRKFKIEFKDDPVIGETVISKINSNPAVEIYRDYLGVYPDSYFISNICEFPLIVERDGINVCLIPIDCGRDGELYFMMKLNSDENLRFSFASHDEVLYSSRDSLDKMECFMPEALFLTLCGNRINFLKEDAHIEWDVFTVSAPDYVLMHGACELFYHKGKGGVLNSAHLAVGLKENSIYDISPELIHPDVGDLRKGRVLPLSDRMSYFLRKVSSDLQETATEAKNANSAKTAFLSHMSHEIRTPINAVLGMDEMILRESTEPDILNYAEDIRSAGNNLLGIVNDVLDFSKIEAGKMSIIPVEYEVASLVNDLYNTVRIRADRKGLEVRLDIDPSVPSVIFGDETRIRQVITNLLTNAVKYTEEGSVTLSIKKVRENSPEDRDSLALSCPGEECPKSFIRIRAEVKDTGIGIRREDINKLFDEFIRMDERRNRAVEGTGLGLNITRELLDLMGSRLFVDSVYGEGSVFSFEILQGVVRNEPVGNINGKLKSTSHQQYHVKFTAEDANLLVVDDTKVNLDVIKNLLKNTKIKIDTAESGAEALELVRRNEYDVIFLDHLMPKMDGPETLRKMMDMKDNLSSKAPVISLTANALSGARDQYLKAGFKDYLSKPVNPRELEDMLFKFIPPEKVRTLSGQDDKKNDPGLPSWLFEAEGIDTAAGIKSCSSADIYLIALEAFYETISENADEIEAYYRREDIENYTVKVHAVKSSARTIGALALSEKAAALEKAGHSSDLTTIRGNTEEFLKDYRAFLKILSPLQK